jgi:NADH-quinone oxidoreductase subunit M
MLSDWPILSLVIWLPIAGGVVTLLAGRGGDGPAVRWIALVFAVVTFLVSVPLYTLFDTTTYQMQFTELVPWIGTFNINYALGVDEIGRAHV